MMNRENRCFNLFAQTAAGRQTNAYRSVVKRLQFVFASQASERSRLVASVTRSTEQKRVGFYVVFCFRSLSARSLPPSLWFSLVQQPSAFIRARASERKCRALDCSLSSPAFCIVARPRRLCVLFIFMTIKQTKRCQNFVCTFLKAARHSLLAT